MRRIPDRSAWLRLGLFLVIVTAAVAFVTARARMFLESRGDPLSAQSSGVPALDSAAGPSAVTAVSPSSGAPAGQSGGTAVAPGAVPAGTGARQSSALGSEAGDATTLALVRLDRDRARAQEREMLQEVLRDQSAGEAERSQAARRYMDLGQQMALEVTLEGLLRGRGYPDAVVILGAEGGAQVILGTASITREQAAAVADLVSAMAHIPPESIRIVTRVR